MIDTASKQKGPVFITDRRRPAHVLLTIEQYRKITNQLENIADLLAVPGANKIEFEPPRLTGNLHRSPDLS